MTSWRIQQNELRQRMPSSNLQTLPTSKLGMLLSRSPQGSAQQREIQSELRRRGGDPQTELLVFIRSRGGAATERDVYTNYTPLKNKSLDTRAALEELAKAGHGHWIEARGRRGLATREF
jgi:hypothetical protein